jgi:hypothetical protein
MRCVPVTNSRDPDLPLASKSVPDGGGAGRLRCSLAPRTLFLRPYTLGSVLVALWHTRTSFVLLGDIVIKQDKGGVSGFRGERPTVVVFDSVWSLMCSVCAGKGRCRRCIPLQAWG